MQAMVGCCLDRALTFMSKAFQVKSYLTYWLDAVDEHSLHSPFFFDFHNKVVKQPTSLDNTNIETLRKALLNDRRIIQVEDLGAGSQAMKGSARRISDIARTTLSAEKFSKLYQRVIEYYIARNVIELG